MQTSQRLLRRVVIPGIPAVLGATTAEAVITYVNPADLTVSTGDYIRIDFSGLNTAKASDPLAPPGWDLVLGHFYYDLDLPFIYTRGDSGSQNYAQVGLSGYVTKFAFGATIDSGSSWSNPPTYSAINNIGANDANWAPGTIGYIGVRFDNGGGNFNYAWVQIGYSGLDRSLTVYDFAFEQTLNAPILAGAGAIPEPTTTAVLAGLLAGSAALYARRRRTQAEPVASA